MAHIVDVFVAQMAQEYPRVPICILCVIIYLLYIISYYIYMYYHLYCLNTNWVIECGSLKTCVECYRMEVEPPGPEPLSPPSEKRTGADWSHQTLGARSHFAKAVARFSTYSRDMFDRRRDRHERSDRPERRAALKRL